MSATRRQLEWYQENKERIRADAKARRDGPRREELLQKKRESYERTKRTNGRFKDRWRLCPERLAERIRVAANGCWEWTGGIYKVSGYGRVQIDGKSTTAHHAVYEMLRGPLSAEQNVCHDCPGGDNRLCVNPDHMFIGTDAQNNADMVSKGRNARGERIASSKLTVELVRQIRREYKPFVLGSHRLARRFGVSKCTVQRIINREVWKHVA